jgi:hypothetical protein
MEESEAEPRYSVFPGRAWEQEENKKNCSHTWALPRYAMLGRLCLPVAAFDPVCAQASPGHEVAGGFEQISMDVDLK